MSEQTPAEQPLDIITQLTVRPTSTGWNTPTALHRHTGLHRNVSQYSTLSFFFIINYVFIFSTQSVEVFKMVKNSQGKMLVMSKTQQYSVHINSINKTEMLTFERLETEHVCNKTVEITTNILLKHVLAISIENKISKNNSDKYKIQDQQQWELTPTLSRNYDRWFLKGSGREKMANTKL